MCDEKKGAAQQLSHHYASLGLTHEYSYSRVYIYIYSNFFIFLPFFLSTSPFNSLTGLETERQNLFISCVDECNECNFSFFFFFFWTRIHLFTGEGEGFICISFSENTFCVLITVEEEEEKSVRELISILFLQILLTCRIV